MNSTKNTFQNFKEHDVKDSWDDSGSESDSDNESVDVVIDIPERQLWGDMPESPSPIPPPPPTPPPNTPPTMPSTPSPSPPLTPPPLPSMVPISRLSKDEWNQIRTQGFETMQDPKKRKAILFKSSACRHGVNCDRFKNGINCDFYHYAQERRIPMCPFKQTCTSSGCNHCHPGQEEEWLKRNPLPEGYPICKPVPKPDPMPKSEPTRKPVQKLEPVRIESSVFKTNPEAATLAMQVAINAGREVIIFQA